MKKYINNYLIFIISIAILLFGCINWHKDTVKLDGLSIDQKWNAFEDNENWYYFDNGLYKLNKESNIKTLIRQEKYFGNYYLYDEWIYYVTSDDEIYFKICRINKNGGNYSVLFDAYPFAQYEGEPIHEVAVFENNLFVQMSFSLYCHDIITEETIEIDGNAREFEIVVNKLYYLSDFSIYEMDIKTKEVKILLGTGKIHEPDEETERYSNFIFIEDEMYYYKRFPYGLYRYQNGKNKLISDSENINEYSLFEHDMKLYYVQQFNEEYKLMQYNPADESIKELLSFYDFSTGARIIGDYFYYFDKGNEWKRVKMNS